MSSSSIDPNDVWIYHERQEALLCGQHALNNLTQSKVFSVGELSEIAHQLDQMELTVYAQNNEGGVRSKEYLERLREGSTNVDAQGNFSIQVLKAALQSKYGISLPHLSEQDLLSGKDITDFEGFICHKSDHWFTIRKIADRFWNLNSILELPVPVSHFKLATEMEKWKTEGYTIFCVPHGLPPAGKKNGTGPEWHCMAQLLRGTSSRDPWENVGSGMRLDGASTTGSTAVAASSVGVIEGLTEEEQLQLALQASLEPPPKMSKVVSDDFSNVVVPDEPAAGTPDAVRIQFRLPEGRRVRRFRESDTVSAVYAYVQQECAGRPVSLLCGFPPKDLGDRKTETIAQAKLANESIQARYQ